VGEEGEVELVQDRRGQAVLPDGDHGVEVMGQGAQLAAPGGIEGRHDEEVYATGGRRRPID
jgi:hypothetical protein